MRESLRTTCDNCQQLSPNHVLLGGRGGGGAATANLPGDLKMTNPDEGKTRRRRDVNHDGPYALMHTVDGNLNYEVMNYKQGRDEL